MDPASIFDVSCGHSHVDGESNGLKMSLDEKLGIPLVVTRGARISRNVVKTLGGDAVSHRSTRVWYSTDRLRYDGFSTHHYAYMVKILEEPEPTVLRMQLERKFGKQPWMRRWQPWMQTTLVS